MKRVNRAVSLSEPYMNCLEQYARLTGMSRKEAAEYAIECTIVPKLGDYQGAADGNLEEWQKTERRAGSILPPKFNVRVSPFFDVTTGRREPLIIVDASLDQLRTTAASAEAVSVFRDELRNLAETGGTTVLVNEGKGSPGIDLKVRRRGSGLVFEDAAAVAVNGNTGATVKSTLPTSSIRLLLEALDLVLTAFSLRTAAEDREASA